MQERLLNLTISDVWASARRVKVQVCCQREARSFLVEDCHNSDPSACTIKSCAAEGERYHGVLWPHLPASVQVRRGVLAEESGALMKEFFQARRLENDKRILDIGSTRPEDGGLTIDVIAKDWSDT